ncbi:MAG: hypothetical protein NVS9B13_15320 [Candidatus Acidiferrum sp.]
MKTQGRMPVRPHLSGYGWLTLFGDPAVRTGIYTGVGLGFTFSVWIILANRALFLERFALERNQAAAVLLGLLAVIPVLRFYRDPGKLLISSLIGWSILTFFYRLLCAFFGLLSEKYSTFHIFMLGAVLYMIVGTVSWVGTVIWRVRETHGSHFNHHAD